MPPNPKPSDETKTNEPDPMAFAAQQQTQAAQRADAVPPKAGNPKYDPKAWDRAKVRATREGFDGTKLRKPDEEFVLLINRTAEPPTWVEILKKLGPAKFKKGRPVVGGDDEDDE